MADEKNKQPSKPNPPPPNTNSKEPEKRDVFSETIQKVFRGPSEPEDPPKKK